MLTFAERPSTMSSLIPVEIPQNPLYGQQRQQISELQFAPQSFLCWTIRFKTQVTTCSDFPSESYVMDQRSGDGRLIHWMNPRDPFLERIFPISRCWTRRVRLLRKRIIQNSQFKKKASLEERKAQKEDRFLREDRPPSRSASTFE